MKDIPEGSIHGDTGRPMMLGLDTLHEKGWFKSLAAITGFLVSAVGLFGAAMTYIHHEPAAPASRITRAPVTQTAPAAPGQRTVDDALRQKLDRVLKSKDTIIIVACQHQDDEAASYGRDILSYLHDAGYTNASFASTGFPPSFHGVDIETDGNRAFIKVGRQ